MSQASDLELLRSWRSGDNRAGSVFYKRHASAISRFFHNKLSVGDDASDLLHDTFLALHRSPEGGDGLPPHAVWSYVYATARHVLCGHLRKKYKRSREQLDFSAVCVRDLEPTGMSTIMLQRRDLQIFVDALRAIPLDDQVLLEFKFFDGLSVREIADLLEIPETAVPGRLQRAKGRLRQLVEQLAAKVQDMEIREPSDDELDRWAQEIREQMGWQHVRHPV